MTGEKSLAGRRAIVTGTDQAFGRALLAALRAAGAAAAPAAWTDASRRGVRRAFDEAVAALGGLDVVIHAAFVPALLTSRPLLSISEPEWQEGCEASLETALFVLQESHDRFREGGGRIVLVSPTLSTAGEAGFVPLATAAEAIRVLGKTAAKQWGRHGITVNSLAPGLEALVDGAGSASEAPTSIDEPALPDFDARRDVAPLIGFLASEAAAGLTAATLRFDGGLWTAG